MLKITILRHGMTDGNSKGKFIGVTDEPLLEEEKKSLAELKYPAVEAVYCSPMTRSVQTAQILYPYVKATVVKQLAERDFGFLEGKTYSELADDPRYKEWSKEGEQLNYPDAESISDFTTRCITGLEEIIRDAVKRKITNIAIVAHGGTIMSLLHEYGIPKHKYLEWMTKNGEGYRIRLAPEDFAKGADVQKRKIIIDGKVVRPGN